MSQLKAVKIQVTQWDIDRGARCVSTCPVALAAQRTFGRTAKVSCISIWSYGGIFIPLPRRAREFVSRFDSHKPVKPFTFTVKFLATENQTEEKP